MPLDQILATTALLPGGPEVLRNADQRMSELVETVGQPCSKDDVLAMDWLGIGDACCHSRLILQHLAAKGKKITWIATEKVACLYRDDQEMRVLKGFSNPFRIPLQDQVVVSHKINELFEEKFPGWERFHISHLVMCNYFRSSDKNICAAFFRCCGMERDFSIKHSLRHLGVPPDDVKRPYVVLEYIGQSTGRSDPERVKRLVGNLSNIGVSSVCVGARDGWIVPGAEMRLGVNLYDTFSMMKGAVAMVGRASGNHSMVCYLPELPVFEVDVNWHNGHNACRVHPKTTTTGSEWDAEIPRTIAERKLA